MHWPSQWFSNPLKVKSHAFLRAKFLVETFEKKLQNGIRLKLIDFLKDVISLHSVSENATNYLDIAKCHHYF